MQGGGGQLAGCGEQRLVIRCARLAGWLITQPTQPQRGGFVLQQLVGEGQRTLQQIALDQRVHQQRAADLLGLHHIAAHDQRQCAFHSQRARQTLRATGTGQDAQLHLGQGQLGAG